MEVRRVISWVADGAGELRSQASRAADQIVVPGWSPRGVFR